MLYRTKSAKSMTDFSRCVFIEMSNHFKSVRLFLLGGFGVRFPRPLPPRFCSFFQRNFSTFFLLFFRMFFNFLAANFPIGLRGFFRFFAVAGKMGTARTFHSFSPLCECVAGSQIGHLLCEDCKFLIHVRRCHTIRITRKASPPCVPAGKTVQWTIFVKGTYRVVTKCDYPLSLRCKETK